MDPRRALLPLVVLLLALGCSPASHLVGSWESTAEEGAAEPSQGEKGVVEALRDALGAAARASSRVELTLERDGTGFRRNAAFGAATEQEIWWRVREAGDDRLLLEIAEDPLFADSETWPVRLLDRDRFEASVPVLGPTVFRRAESGG